MANKNLIILGDLRAQCACGGWEFQGVMAEAQRAIARLHEEHRWSCALESRKPARGAAGRENVKVIDLDAVAEAEKFGALAIGRKKFRTGKKRK